MAKALIRLAYRHIIDENPKSNFEKNAFNDSYKEFLLKIQAYNTENKLTRFSDIVAKDGRANSLHYKSSFAIVYHLGELNQIIPDLTDTAGRHKIPFEVPEFKILESDTLNKQLHKVAVIYITGIFTLYENFGEYLLLAFGDQSAVNAGEPVETFTLKMNDQLSVIEYTEVETMKPIVFSEA